METVITQHAEHVERELIEAGREIETRSTGDKWELGRLANEFVTLHQLGSDQKFADQIGSQQQRINECRRIWEERQDYRSSGNLSWTHLRVSLAWPDADECLKWAADTGANVAEMTAWRRVRNGESLKPEPVKVPAVQVPEPDAPIVTPEEPVASQPVRSPAVATPDEPKAPPTQKDSPPDLQAGTKSAIKSLRQLAAQADQSAKQSVARSLRRLADEFDPPAKRSKFVPPTLDEVQEYFAQKGTHIDANVFWAHYDSNGWKQSSGNKVQSWKSCLVTWEARDRPTSGTVSTRVRSKDPDAKVVYRDFE